MMVRNMNVSLLLAGCVLLVAISGKFTKRYGGVYCLACLHNEPFRMLGDINLIY
jgi:hypothetical protein